MDSSANNKMRNIWIVAGIVFALGAVAAVVVYALAVSSTDSEPSTSKSPAPWPRVATQDEVKQNLTDLEATLKQSTSDQAAAKATLNDNEKQIKIGN